jgi:hypothetical protein
MARLRIRIELSRGGAGVPLGKLASVIAESQKFLNLLTEDVRMDRQKGEWLGFDFDPESLNFTAEFVGPATGAQVEAFNAAFDGSTSLRRDTIGQFLRITESIGEDEIIGFGLYQSDDVPEPTEWRCLSRRDALRIADEVQVLIGSSRLPAVGDPALGARMFGDRRERKITEAHRLEHERAVESALSTRMDRLEGQVDEHSGMLQDLRQKSTATETSFLNLLSTFETFCDQATYKIEKMSPLALPPAPQETPLTGSPRTRSWARFALAVCGVVATAGIAGALLWPVPHQASSIKQEVVKQEPVKPDAVKPDAVKPDAVKPDANAPVAPKVSETASAKSVAPAPPPVASPPKPAPSANTMQVDVSVTEPSWVTLREAEGHMLLSQLLLPGTTKSIVLEKTAILRVGNASGVVVHLNGRPIGPIGSGGQVRDVEFSHGEFTIHAPRP